MSGCFPGRLEQGGCSRQRFGKTQLQGCLEGKQLFFFFEPFRKIFLYNLILKMHHVWEMVKRKSESSNHFRMALHSPTPTNTLVPIIYLGNGPKEIISLLGQ